MKRRTLGLFGSIAASALLVAACGTGTTADSGSDDTNDAAAEAGSLTLGFPAALGPTDTFILAALNSLEDDGWDVDYVEFDSPDIQTQALIGGDIQVAAMGPSTVMSANEANANLRMVGNGTNLDYLIVGSPEVTECSDFDGKTVAYHSEGATTTSHLRKYLADTCPEADPEFVVISGSANRVIALEEGQIDGTVVRSQDWIEAEVEESVAHVVDNLAETQSQYLAHTVVVDEDSLDEIRSGIELLLERLDEHFAMAHNDAGEFAAISAPLLNMEEVEVERVVEGLLETDTVPESHKLEESQVEATLDFYKEIDRVDDSTTVEDVSILDIQE